MRKVLNITLMTTFAIALLGLQTVAFGTAPTIDAIPNPIIVGDAEPSTPDANFFVFPDAIDLRQFCSDESILPGDLSWTYTISSGTPIYLINGVQPLNMPAEDPGDVATNPAVAAKVINDSANVSPYEWDPDGNANTITIRNNNLTPLSNVIHVGDYPEPATTGILASENQLVTLFVSDGTTLDPNFDQVDVDFKTDNDGNDRFGTEARAAGVIRQVDFVSAMPTGALAWSSGDVFGDTTFPTGNGLSLRVPNTAPAAVGVNMGIWSSPDNYIQLVANSVWRMKMTVTCDQTVAFEVPLWDVILENYSGAIGGPFGYGLDYYILDNAGGANAAGTVGRTDFQIWYTPAAITTAQFAATTNGAFDPNLDSRNDMRVRFRILDSDSAGINAQIDDGTLSLEKLEIHRFDLSKITPATTTNVFDATTITNGEFGATGASSFTVSYIEGTVVSFTGNALTVNPENATLGWGGTANSAEVITIQPGDNSFNPVTGASIADNFPITWESDTLYRTQVTMAASGATGQTNPPDAIFFINDTPQNELTALSYVTPGLKWPDDATGLPAAMPRGAAVYQSFFYSHSVSRVADSNLRRIRPLLQVICTNNLVLGGITRNTGGVTFSSVKVDKVAFTD